jgi:hypothetical protein
MDHLQGETISEYKCQYYRPHVIQYMSQSQHSYIKICLKIQTLIYLFALLYTVSPTAYVEFS